MINDVYYIGKIRCCCTRYGMFIQNHPKSRKVKFFKIFKIRKVLFIEEINTEIWFAFPRESNLISTFGIWSNLWLCCRSDWDTEFYSSVWWCGRSIRGQFIEGVSEYIISGIRVVEAMYLSTNCKTLLPRFLLHQVS